MGISESVTCILPSVYCLVAGLPIASSSTAVPREPGASTWNWKGWPASKELLWAHSAVTSCAPSGSANEYPYAPSGILVNAPRDLELPTSLVMAATAIAAGLGLMFGDPKSGLGMLKLKYRPNPTS